MADNDRGRPPSSRASSRSNITTANDTPVRCADCPAVEIDGTPWIPVAVHVVTLVGFTITDAIAMKIVDLGPDSTYAYVLLGDGRVERLGDGNNGTVSLFVPLSG